MRNSTSLQMDTLKFYYGLCQKGSISFNKLFHMLDSVKLCVVKGTQTVPKIKCLWRFDNLQDVKDENSILEFIDSLTRIAAYYGGNLLLYFCIEGFQAL